MSKQLTLFQSFSGKHFITIIMFLVKKIIRLGSSTQAAAASNSQSPCQQSNSASHEDIDGNDQLGAVVVQ